MPAKPYVGRPIKRVEDPRLIRGEGVYVDDLRLAGMKHAMFLRSPYAHARITAIRTEAARALPGVAGVFTGADVNDRCGPLPQPKPRKGQKSPVHQVLAADRAYYVGHAVAVVVADTPSIARDALDRIEVDYDPLPAVVDPEKALEKDSPLTHPHLGTNRSYVWTLEHGDVKACFRKADKVVTIRMHHQRLTPMAIEPRGCIASWLAGEESMTLWTSTQIPHIVRMKLHEALRVPETRVRVVAPEVGGGFGAKLNLYPEEIVVAHLSMRLGAPVKWIQTRREDAAATIHGRDQIGDYRVAVKKDGRILAIESDSIADIGSHLQMGTPVIPTLTGLMLCGCYTLKATKIRVTGVHTNKMATDAYRGAGRPEATYLIERLVDVIAAELGLDRVDIRRKNFIKPSQFPYTTATGVEYDSGRYAASLDKALELSGWDRLLKERDVARKKGRVFGVGLSTYVEICAFGPSKGMSAGGWEWGSVRVEPSGHVTVITGATPHGQGQETSFAQIVADRLGIAMEDVTVLRGDTAIAPHGRDTYGSRATALGGSALVMCVDKLVAKGKKLAAHLLGVPASKVVFANGRFSAKGRSKKKPLDIKAVAKAAVYASDIPRGFEPGFEASSFFEPKAMTFPFGCHVAAVEIDRDTGLVRLVKYTHVDDCGPRINPLLVEGQLQGGIAQSIGQALLEKTVYDEGGQLVTGEFMDYALPRAADIPDTVMGETVTPTKTNPLGIKGVGEAGTIGATPAVANAVLDALAPFGVRHLDLPLTPEKVWRAMEP